MKLSKVRVQNYRSIYDSGWFDIEDIKTIIVGPNEAGKTALLQAIQQINAPKDIKGFDSLRDYPRSKYNDITRGEVLPEDVNVVEACFTLDAEDIDKLPDGFENCIYTFGRQLDNSSWHKLQDAPASVLYKNIQKDLQRLTTHMNIQFLKENSDDLPKPSDTLQDICLSWTVNDVIDDTKAKQLLLWLADNLVYVDEENEKEEQRYDKIITLTKSYENNQNALEILNNQIPVFILFSNYFKVKPLIILEHLASRLESGILDDEAYDYGNKCLLKLLGFTARELSDLGKITEPRQEDKEGMKKYKDQLDERSYQLNAASVQLTQEIQSIWQPDIKKGEANKLKVQVDGQYLKVVVEDDLGVEIELDQRSEGFQWLVSFFVVFFAEVTDSHSNSILLLDEPGLNLHALKQRDFQTTLSRLAETSQTIYTTHSPFLVGSSELDLVRVVEMSNRTIGTKVHTTVTADDPAALLPLQEALGYDLAQSLFSQQRNLILEGLTDYWYLDGISQLLREENLIDLNEKIALVPANTASKVVYFATILHANKLKVAALLDSDSAGDQVAKQDTLIHTLGNKNILRTKDVYTGSVDKPEIEDLLRDTLVSIAKEDLGWDVCIKATEQVARPIVDILQAEIPEFSKYKLAKAFLRWSRNHEASSLLEAERQQWIELIKNINKSLK